jgi:hypothetical protein
MFVKECVMTRLASMILPVLAGLLFASAAEAGAYYERVGVDRYRPVDGARYSSSCCYKKITKHVTITKTVWVKVPPPRPHRHHVVDEEFDRPRPAPHVHRGDRVVELGEVIRRGDACRKAVPVRDGDTYIIVMVNVRCR